MKRSRIAVLTVACVMAAGFALAQTAEAPKKMVPPIRGTAQIGHLPFKTSPPAKGVVVTKIVLKNLSNAPIVGLKVDEFWYDKEGNTLPGDSQRYRKPFEPGEVIELTLTTPHNPKMFSQKLNFTHANGDVKLTKLDKIDKPPTP